MRGNLCGSREIVAAILLAVFFVVCVVFWPKPVLSQGICGTRDAALAYLARQYGERPRAIGLAANGQVVEVLASQSGSWTMLVTRPDGLACVVASGEAWETLPKTAEGPGL